VTGASTKSEPDRRQTSRNMRPSLSLTATFAQREPGGRPGLPVLIENHAVQGQQMRMSVSSNTLALIGALFVQHLAHGGDHQTLGPRVLRRAGTCFPKRRARRSSRNTPTVSASRVRPPAARGRVARCWRPRPSR